VPEHDDLRRFAFALAYRLTGSVADAEDLVQEAMLRLHSAEGVENPRAYLATVVTRLGIDHQRSARVRRERPSGTWLPEPLVGEQPDVADDAALAESVSVAFLVLLEALSPVERAVLLLHDVFDYGFAEIAAITGKTEANCRQIAVRARKAVQARRPRYEPDRHEELVERFLAAVREGEVEAFVELLAEDAAFYGDGGDKALAIARPRMGRVPVARLLTSYARQGAAAGVAVEAAVVNGRTGCVFRDAEGRLISVMDIETAGGRIVALRNLLDPDKLRHLGPTSPLALRR
jgi:RNA polymerase sigma-70 factor, ECF subfamily